MSSSSEHSSEPDQCEDFKRPGYFPFPFTPYDIQEDLMKNLYSAIEEKKIGIFESPTGTGKSLSLICGVLTWLRDYERKQQEELEKVLQAEEGNQGSLDKEGITSDEPSWVNDYEEKRAHREVIDKLNSKKTKQEKSKAKLEQFRKFAAARKKRKREESTNDDVQREVGINEAAVKDAEYIEEDEDLILKDYNSDAEERKDSESSSGSDCEPEEDDNAVKIYYCSRTHSQLAQFVSEIKKSPFGQNTNVVSLGSRQNFCINEDVRRLRSINRVNERCLELQRAKNEKKTIKDKSKRRKTIPKGCQFYQKKKLREFAENVFFDVQDIEQLVELGKDLETCPYYGSRLAVPQAQVVVLPYNTLLHKSTRDAVGIKLKDSVIIVDEAHNLIDTINTLHSVEISGSHISTSRDQLWQYLSRYRSRLKAKNLMYINQLLSAMDTFIKFLGGCTTDTLKENCNVSKTKEGESTLHTINDFVFSARIDNLNLFKIRRYCERSMISKKLNGFVDKYQNAVGTAGNESDAMRTSQFYHIEAFLDALTNANEDGRILVIKNALLSKCSLKFLLLNPAVHFAEITKEARAVIVAGGTMQPISEFKDVLLYSAGVPVERIVEFSCGHVIPPENLVAIALSKGPSSLDLDFTYQSRDQNNMIEELGRLIVNVCTVVPAGVVCFFPSYDYEEKVHTKWIDSGIMQRIEARKKVFREPRKSGSIDQVLGSYSQCIKRSAGPRSPTAQSKQNGAVLFSVVGGKMSEGINFSDDLGRCILMVGLPYPNKNSPELKEKMDYLDKTVGQKSGQQHYENICMKAVNQSIGRAIRHRQDYACIILLDQRYSKKSVQNKLPSWIQSRLHVHPRFGPAFAALNKGLVDFHIKTETAMHRYSVAMFFVDKRSNP